LDGWTTPNSRNEATKLKEKIMLKMKTMSILAIAGFVLALAPAAQAAEIELGDSLIPAGLGLGDTFQLVFVSSTTRDAESDDIADYNTHVQNAANATTDLSGYTWKAIASTQTDNVQANNNVSVTEAVYLVNGTKVASAGAFWAKTHDAAININENGDGLDSNVWTGSNWEGWKNNSGLGASGGVNDPKESVYGLSDVNADKTWAGEAGLVVQSTELPFYAVSEVLTVIVPEPATMSLLAIGGIALIRRRRRA
jgi:hypothetical protein